MNWFKSMLLLGLLMVSVISLSSAVQCYDCKPMHDGCVPFDDNKASELPTCNGTACKTIDFCKQCIYIHLTTRSLGPQVN